MSRPLANTFRPEPPSGEWYRWAHNTLLSVQAATIPPNTVTNMRATALPGAIQVDFTRSDGDAYTLYRNTAPSINGATRIDLGTANTYVDNIGDVAIKRFYLVVTKAGNRESEPSTWVNATTLALNTPVTPPTPPPPADIAFTDQETDSVSVSTPDSGSYAPL